MVRRRRCPEDGRKVLCIATDEALRALDRPMSEVGVRVLGRLGARRTRALIELLDEARGSAREASVPKGSRARRTITSKETVQ